MNILMLVSGTIHSSISHRALSFARELVRSGHHVTIIAPSADKYSDFNRDGSSEIDGVRMVYPLQFKTRNFLLNLVPYILSSTAQVLRIQADVVYIYKPTPITITGVLAKWLKRTPVVLDMDDLGSEVMLIEKNPALICKAVELCEKLAAHEAKAIVAASTLLEDLYKTRFPGKPVLRLSNGVHPNVIKPVNSNRPPRIIFFGALNRARIMLPLLEALPTVIEKAGKEAVHVDILGDGICRPELEATTKQLGLENHVTFHGWTKLSQLPQLLGRGDIGICMMPAERTTAACSNQKVFQYMAMELCVVASNVGDLPMYLEEGKAGVIVPAGDSQALAAAIADLLRHPIRRSALAKRGRRLTETTYSWTTLTQKLEALLETQV